MAGRCTTWTYDADGNMLSEEYDGDGDGKADYRETHTYDANGNMLTEEHDYDDADGSPPADGTMDVRITYTYDEYGNKLSEERDGFDMVPPDGTPEERTAWTYDEHGNKLTEEQDADGTPEERTTWTYDEHGNKLTEEQDANADGTPEERTTWTYDANGNLLTEEGDLRADGRVDRRTTYTYDADGNILSEEYAVGVDGWPTERNTWTYDEHGNMLGDFGYGWTLDIKQGSVQHNRRPGDGYTIYTPSGEWQFPCQGTFEHRSHYTIVHLSEREAYVFRPRIANAESVTGGCRADVYYEFVEGWTKDAQLDILGNTQVMSGGQMQSEHLYHALHPDEIYNPEYFLLTLKDGRKFEVNVHTGITRMEDANGNSLQIQSNGLFASSGKHVYIERDGQGRVEFVQDPMGNRVTYSYGLTGDLSRVTDQLDRRTRYFYHRDIPHHLKRIEKHDGTQVAEFRYDEDGRLIGLCDADYACSTMQHDLENKQETFIDAAARPTNYLYDDRGNVIEMYDGLNNKWQYFYDCADNLTFEIDPLGGTTSYVYEACIPFSEHGTRDMLERVLPHEADEDPADFTYTYEYNDRGQRTKMTLPSGGSLHWDYDSDGNLTALKDMYDNVIRGYTYGLNGEVSTYTDRFGTVTYADYDESGNPGVVYDIFGEPAQLTYDGNGNLVQRVERGVTMTFDWDDLGRPSRKDWGNGVSVDYEYRSDTQDWTAIEGPTFGRVERIFDTVGRLSWWKLPNGDEFERKYDIGGLLREETNELGNPTVYDYDLAGRLSSITDVALDAVSRFVRDNAGRVTKTVDALGNEMTAQYKAGGRLRAITNARGFSTSFDRKPHFSSITDALGRTTITSRTQYALPTTVSYPDLSNTNSGYFGTTRLDESQSFPATFVDELDRTRTYRYDSGSALVGATDFSGQEWSYTYSATIGSSLDYDAISGQVDLSPNTGGASSYRFSRREGIEYGDVSSNRDAAGSFFTHTLFSITSPSGETTLYERGPTGKLNKTTYSDGGERIVTYNTNALPERISLPQGTTVNLRHDTAGREVNRDTSLGEHRSLTYGSGVRVKTMTDQTGTTTYSYDEAGRFSGITYPNGASVKYEHDKLGRTTAVRLRPNETAEELVSYYAYSENGSLVSVTDPLGGVTTFEYDSLDRLTSRTLPNGVTSTYAYDDRDRITSIVHSGIMGNVLSSAAYERSVSGEPTKITREDGSYVALVYDPALRIDTETYYDSEDNLLDAIDYDYDLDGNRIAKNSLSGGFETYAYETGSRLTATTRDTDSDTFGYDTGGRMTSIVRNGITRTLEYNSDDKITRLFDNGVETVRYEYDGVGRRVGRHDTTHGERRYLVAPNLGQGLDSPQAVTDGNGNLLSSYVFIGESPIIRIEDGQPVYYLQDAMGSVIGITNASGEVASTFKYDAFGNITSSTGALANVPSAIGFDFRYHGMLSDSNADLLYARARTYDARTGRFTSRDPAEGLPTLPETYNRYSFASSNPHLYRDPTGLYSIMEVGNARQYFESMNLTSFTAGQGADLLRKAPWMIYAAHYARTGVREIWDTQRPTAFRPGRENQHIIDWMSSWPRGINAVQNEGDEAAWCGAFVSAMLDLAGYPRGSPSAGDYGGIWNNDNGYGVDLGSNSSGQWNLRFGAIVVVQMSPWTPTNNASYHVAFYTGEAPGDPNKMLLLGGNQGNMVQTLPYPKADIKAVRWPVRWSNNSPPWSLPE